MIFLFNTESDNCLTPERLAGNCVFLRSCSVLLSLFQKRVITQVDRQYLSSSQCGFQDNKPLVCCKAENYKPLPTDNPQLISQSTNRQFQSSSQPPRNSLLPRIGVCGFDASDRIFGGERTKIDEYPWMALLQYSKRKKFSFHNLSVLLNIFIFFVISSE